MGKLDEILTDFFKCKTHTIENPVIAASAAVPAVFLRNNPDRVAWVLVVLGANPCYLGLTNGIGVANGILVPAGGGWRSMYWQEDFQMVGWAWWIVSPAGASVIYTLEVIGA